MNEQMNEWLEDFILGEDLYIWFLFPKSWLRLYCISCCVDNYNMEIVIKYFDEKNPIVHLELLKKKHLVPKMLSVFF